MKKNSPLVAFLLGALFVSFFTLQIQAQFTTQSRNTITGYVFDQQRSPITQIPVELINDVNSVIQRTRTDGSGRFFFSGVPSGRFVIRVLPLGTNFEEQTQEIEIGGIGALGRPVSDHAQKDFYLRLRRDKANADTVNEVLFVQDVPDNARKLYEKGMSDLESSRIDEGVEELRKSLELFPTYYLALEKLGLIYLSQEKYENAVEILTRMVTVNPRSFNGWYGLSYANYALEKSGAAVESGKKAVSLDSNSVNALLILGVSQRQAKQYEEAEKSLVKAKKLDKGKTSDIYWNLALLYAHNLKRLKDAANELELYLKINPNSPNAENVKKLIKQFLENQAPSK
jgi:tetratricopeptide (TPR) repeat protein